MGKPAVAVVIPSYKVTKHILGVISEIGSEVAAIYVVDDACPQGSGELVRKQCKDKRVKVLFHEVNQGVGGAVVTGYKAALADGFEVIVKRMRCHQCFWEKCESTTVLHYFILPTIDCRKFRIKFN